MELFMTNINPSATRNQVMDEVARALQGAAFAAYPGVRFEVQLFRNRQTGHGFSGKGALTLPDAGLGRLFLLQCGGSFAKTIIQVIGRVIHFQPSRNAPRSDILKNLTMPHIEPQTFEEQETHPSPLHFRSVPFVSLQWGWDCRDNVFSVEWEDRDIFATSIKFSTEKRELFIDFSKPGQLETFHIVIRLSQIEWVAISPASAGEPAIFLSLLAPPSIESFLQLDAKRTRLTALPYKDHGRVVPYTSSSLRLVCTSRKDLQEFRRLASVVHLHLSLDVDYPVAHRNLFSVNALDTFQSWVAKLPWKIAFQVESLVRQLLLDVQEILNLRGKIQNMAKIHGTTFTADFLSQFAVHAQDSWIDSQETQSSQYDIYSCFDRVQKSYNAQSHNAPLPLSEAAFSCFHALVTPTKIVLKGPFPERSNRVIRTYPGYDDKFLRVTFVDENRLQIRFDREVDGRGFIQKRVGDCLLNGITVAGRKFDFLAYSQSSLKEHSVWFVRPFLYKGKVIDPPTIIKSLGTFANLGFDPKLIYCPARYAARLSQAFTATDATVSAQAEEIFFKRDIERDGRCFTDGVGTISRELARAIWKDLKTKTQQGKRMKTYPRAFQVRFMGSKGMLSVDHRLSGRAICLRDSMIKFEAPASNTIEIARAFDKPGRYFLNRPLIMLLEGLGVPYDTFKQYQDDAIYQIQNSTLTLEGTAHLLEAYGLGTSYRLTSVMLNLAKLGITSIEGLFYQKIKEFAVNHILRELKNHARIPVPGGYSLVGVADIHNVLKEGEIFACIREQAGSARKYLSGRILISRSPTIHPGDVQIVRAIGVPPAGTPYDIEPLANTVVFSVQGTRPLPSCLGGGDLDGDEYNLIPLDDIPSFTPTRLCKAASYPAAQRKLLDHPSTMVDVAEFIMEFISSDVVGLVATTWLQIADQSTQGIFDQDCLILAALHSDAVDYPKSGTPVPTEKIPKFKSRRKPDWKAPETIRPNDKDYYKSMRAIGRLFRGIDLPPLEEMKKGTHRPRHTETSVDTEPISVLMARLQIEEDDDDDDDEDDDEDDEVQQAVSDHTFKFISNDMVDEVKSVDIIGIIQRYVSELRSICAAHTLSFSRNAALTEEEAMVGTIVAKSSQPRMRKQQMVSLREQTSHLVGSIRRELAGDEERPLTKRLADAWVAWQFSQTKEYKKDFGWTSFGWIALGIVLEITKELREGEPYQP